MPKELSLAAFDYSSIDKDVKGKLLNLAGQVKRHEKDFIAAGMEIGEAISEAHKLLAGEGREGRFRQWVELETGLSRSSAYDWMNIYERSKKCPILDTLPSTVARMLAAQAVPDAAIKDFEKQVDKGVKPTVAAAKATIQRFVAPKPQPAKEPAAGPEAKAGKKKELAIDDAKCEAEDLEEVNRTPSEQMKLNNTAIASACQKLIISFNDIVPKDIPHLTQTLIDSAKSHLKACCNTLRQAQCSICPSCRGEGCNECRGHGFLPSLNAKRLGRVV